MALFDTKNKTRKQRDKELQEKLRQKKEKRESSGGNTLLEKISLAREKVLKVLSKYKDDYELVTTIEQLNEYKEYIIKRGVCAIDTETTGLDYFNDRLVGLCLYVEGMKACYIPVNHISPIYRTKVKGQLEEKIVIDMVRILVNNDVKFIYHNAKFDLNVLETWCGFEMNTIYWDTMVASHIIKHNVKEHGLKWLYSYYCVDDEKEKNLEVELAKFNNLFKGVSFDLVPLEIAYLYASRDPFMTFKLYEYQYNHIQGDNLYEIENLLKFIEFPLVNVTARMERNGVCLDLDYIDEIESKYDRDLKEKLSFVYKEIDKYKDKIVEYKYHNPNHKLDNPINVDSPSQLSVLLYDIIGLKEDKYRGRSTDAKTLKYFNTPLTNAILGYRKLSTLVKTFIKTMPNHRNKKTGKVHASFNQNGTETGRYSSSKPNLQNIPSKNKDIRKMFVPEKGNVMLSCDYSQQEPRILAHLSKDENFIEAYRTGKDVYATIASAIYGVDYEECLEFDREGNLNKEGKKKRDFVKSIVLGIMYGRGVASIAEQLSVDEKEAQRIIDLFYNNFPKIADYVEYSQKKAKENGYATTVWGRRRYIDGIQLERFELQYIDNQSSHFNPLFDDEGCYNKVPYATKKAYIDRLEKSTYTQKNKIIQEAKRKGISIKDNSYKLAEAKRKCLNSEVQGTAGDMTKKAMVALHNNPRLKELGYKIIICVHDETIGECPYENRKEVAELCSKLMIEASDKVSVPMKCDTEIFDRWYGEKIEN